MPPWETDGCAAKLASCWIRVLSISKTTKPYCSGRSGLQKRCLKMNLMDSLLFPLNPKQKRFPQTSTPQDGQTFQFRNLWSSKFVWDSYPATVAGPDINGQMAGRGWAVGNRAGRCQLIFPWAVRNGWGLVRILTFWVLAKTNQNR